MAKAKSIDERRMEYIKNYPKQQKRAIETVDGMMKEGLAWSDAERILKMAISELGSRRSEEIIERAEDADAPKPY